ncbi:hypothetical protein Rhe02_36220 [Rhizocola hellebori]|uniref:Uncharacterized protein n=1 Tax=Rhizocola hellebori TaxID=1392758 RepID=A0A8J3Q9K1_9ACTN|nr:hypothetical protein [Rhizocola hellebori]GIH05555.1 hypothetical protein Rhe02_36220 [Rhizocola hellebori]
MRRMAHRLTALGVVSGLALAMPAAAVARTGEPLAGSGECVVQQTDLRGRVTGTTVEREGAVYGQFRCAGGQWVFTWAPFGRDDIVTASEIQVDPTGTVLARRLTGPALSRDLTMADMAAIAEATTGSGRAVVERAVVVADDGRQRTPAEIEALLAGRDTTGARVLDVIDRPDAAMSTNDLVGGAGGTPGSTVVYFSIWGAIKGFFQWIADKLNDLGSWLKEHCDIGPSWDGQSIEVTCQI